jgi:hypothetical protein
MLARPSFVADQAGTFSVQLIVDDGDFYSPGTSITVTATEQNLAPIANAGNSRSVKVGAAVQLDGSASFDADGDAITYKWMLMRPQNSKATLDSSGSVKPRFIADVPGAYTATLVVNDGKLDSAPATITVMASAGNLPPVADAGGDRVVLFGSVVELDGSNSADPDGDALTYKWTLTPPQDSKAMLSSATTVKPSFTADVYGTYTVTLVVNDGSVDSAPATATISTSIKPVAYITGVTKAWVGDKVSLSGSTSQGYGPLTYSWKLDAPNGSSAAFDNATIAAPSFIADVAGNTPSRSWSTTASSTATRLT